MRTFSPQVPTLDFLKDNLSQLLTSSLQASARRTAEPRSLGCVPVASSERSRRERSVGEFKLLAREARRLQNLEAG
jgi:hypothetical protein